MNVWSPSTMMRLVRMTSCYTEPIPDVSSYVTVLSGNLGFEIFSQLVIRDVASLLIPNLASSKPSMSTQPLIPMITQTLVPSTAVKLPSPLLRFDAKVVVLLFMFFVPVVSCTVLLPLDVSCYWNILALASLIRAMPSKLSSPSPFLNKA
ncbi:hypothetical protein VNO78_02348 [Psophocarpus tetragonolobus]|uniref:Uncharacterized protein n=1 Tax=Psophocarpus tetragonolobus TaxID=3891 RepID=A0AAN9XV16_PSOTE